MAPFSSSDASLFSGTGCFLRHRAETLAAQARQRPQTARAAREWLRLAAGRAAALGLFPLSRRIAALEQDIL